MTQEQFAHEIAVTVSTVSRWETGHAIPSNLAWRAIRVLAAEHGCAEDLLES
jgi:DNA-binding transcriptional regulator YiaG